MSVIPPRTMQYTPRTLSVFIRHGMYLSAITTLSLSSSILYAQDNISIPENEINNQPSTTLPDIIVTVPKSPPQENNYTIDRSTAATKMDLSFKETPQTVSVITNKQIQDQNLNTLGKVLDSAVGISGRQYGSESSIARGGSGYSSNYARGYRIDNYQIDGISTNNFSQGSTNATDTATLDDVTIVRGATGLLSGAGNPSASVVLNRKQPNANKQTTLNATIDSWGMYRGMVDSTGALNDSGSLRGRMVAAYRQGKTFRDRETNQDVTLYGIVDTDLSANTTWNLGIEAKRKHNENGTVHSFPYYDKKGEPLILERTDNAASNIAYSNTDSVNLFTNLSHWFNEDWQIKASYSFTKSDIDAIYSVTSFYDRDNNISHTVGKEIRTPTEHAADINVTGKYSLFGQEHDLMAGANYYDYKQNDPGYETKGNPIDFSNWDGTLKGINNTPFDLSFLQQRHKNGNSITNVKQTGGYLATRLNPTENLHTILGGRISNYESYNQSSWSKNTIEAKNVVTPYAGIVYDILPNWSVYSSYTSIFTPQSEKDYQQNLLDPIEGNSIEAGIKGEFNNGRLNAGLSIYQTTQDNKAIEAGIYPDNFANSALANQSYYRAGKGVKTQGAELEIGGQITEDWYLIGGFAHQKSTENDKVVAKDIPQNTFKISTAYNLDNFISGLTVGGSIRWQDTISPNGDTLTELQKKYQVQDDYKLIDVMARYKLNDNVTLGINIDNVTDEKYALNTSNQTWGSPRTYTLGVTANF